MSLKKSSESLSAASTSAETPSSNEENEGLIELVKALRKDKELHETK